MDEVPKLLSIHSYKREVNWFERHKPDFEPRYKSRLVGCGNFEQDDGIRADAPTSDLETHCVVAAFAACNRTTTRNSDISNAYLSRLKP